MTAVPQMTDNNLTALTCARPGRRLRLVRVDRGARLSSRLYAMGLTPGMPFALVADSGGPVVLDVLGSRLVIGRGMAARIMVRET